MARPRADWIATLRLGDRVVAERRVPENGRLWIGEGGDLVVPGIAGRVPLVSGARVHPVAGLRSAGEPTAVPAEGEELVLGVEAHPEITVTLERQRPDRAAFRGGLGRPWAELAYGTAMVACIGALLLIATADEDRGRLEDQQEDRDEEPHLELDDRSPIVLAMLEAPPVTFVAPPPPLITAEIVEPEGEHGRDEAPAEDVPAAPPLEVLEQPSQVEAPPLPAVVVPEIPRKRRSARRRGRPDREDEKVAYILGTSGEPTADLLASIDDAGAPHGLGRIGLLREEEPPSPSHWAVRGIGDEAPPAEPDATAKVIGGTANAGAIADVLPADPPTVDAIEDVVSVRAGSGVAMRGSAVRSDPDCERVPSPRSQVDVVFVVDVSGGMVDAIAAISAQVSALDREARRFDETPRYGLVAFVDEVELVGGRDGFSDAVALERALDGLLARAGTDRQPDGSRGNDEPEDAGLDALHTAATRFAWRDAADTLRLVVYSSDSAAADEGAVLSGRTVEHDYPGVLRAFTQRSIRLASFTAPAGSAGFASSRGTRRSLPVATGGVSFELGDLVGARHRLGEALAPVLANPVCREDPAEPARP